MAHFQQRGARRLRPHAGRLAGRALLVTFLALPSAPAFANTLGENGAWQFKTTADSANQAAAAVSTAPPPSAHSSPPADIVGAIQDEWIAADGASLSATLTGWAQRAGWTVVWETDDDFRLSAGGVLEGDFPTAAGGLIEAFSHARPRLRAIFYAGNKVLRVWTERNEP